jgi:polyribonucleotide nucleotidyltransferase
MKLAIDEATEARAKILTVMTAALASHRTEMSQYAPRIETLKIPVDKIGLLIGPGGKTIKGIVAETGAEINIEDDGSVHIYSSNGESLRRAKEIISGMTKEIEVGEMYQGTVVKVGDQIWVKCIGVDDRGKVKLSRKAAMKDRDQGASAPAEALA